MEWQHKFDYLGFWFSLTKMRKIMIIDRLIFNKRNIYRNLYFFIFDTKMTIFPHKVRHVSARRDVCLRLTANYLHIDIFDQNIKKN